ncbi:MAG TPA: T3SS effector HopA1 family protein [Solirubrobacteraceae bacterium]|nr:T3SS effector HopA1 family protein [Solirubrobacteraceae bacterium]
MSGYRALALAALRAVQVRSATSYSWCGAVSAPLDPQIESAMTPEVAREFLVYQLQQELYGSFYCRGFPAPGSGRTATVSPAVNSSAFVEALSAANHARGTLQPGWQIRERDAGQLVVERDGLALWVAPTQTVAEHGATHVRLRMPSELRKASPGFYMALGERAIAELESAGLVRLYWHLTSGAAPKLLDLLTRSLNRAGYPFQLKVINDRDGYDRCDAGVLYAPRELFAELSPSVVSAHRAIERELRSTTPAFTKRLAHGLGLAEDPGGGQSFGMHRALLLARAAVRAHERACQDDERREAVLEEVFAEQGLDLDRPYLCRDSNDDYALAAR